MLIRRGDEPWIMEARRPREASLNHHSVGIAAITMAFRAEGVESFAPALDEREGHRWPLCEDVARIVLASDAPGGRSLDDTAVAEQTRPFPLRILLLIAHRQILVAGRKCQRTNKKYPSHGRTGSTSHAPKLP